MIHGLRMTLFRGISKERERFTSGNEIRLGQREKSELVLGFAVADFSQGREEFAAVDKQGRFIFAGTR